MLGKTTRREFLRAAGAAAGAAAFGRAAPAGQAPPRRPNVVFVFIDDMGYADLSCFGNRRVKTPNIDRLAAGGIRLTSFYVNSPICSPSRVAVTTGQYPARHRITSYLAARKANRERGMADWLDPKAQTVARTFQAAGYATGHFGKWHMGGGRDVQDAPLPSAYGFDEHFVNFEGMGPKIDPRQTPKHQWTRLYVDKSIDFIRRNKLRPFYLHLWPNDVHDAHVPLPELKGAFDSVTDNPFERKFFAVLTEMDRQLGRLFDEIDRLGLAENTILVLTSDNGPTDWASYYKAKQAPPGSTGPLFGRKWCLYEGGIRMPFIARWKGRIPAGRTDEGTVMAAIDLFPTFCALADVPPPKGWAFDGLDMSRALLGEPVVRSRPIFWQYGGVRARLRPGNPKYHSPSLAVREGQWKLLVEPDGSGVQLFDLAADPSESGDLARQKPEIATRLSETVRAWWKTMPGPHE